MFVPAYACLVYAVIFFINWKKLHLSQRIFSLALIALMASTLLFVSLMTNDVEACKSLFYVNSFASPALIVLLFLFVYSQMQTKSIFQWKLLPLYLIPFVTLTMAVLNRFIYGSEQTDLIALRMVTDDDSIELTPLMEVQYFLFKCIMFIGDAVIVVYSIYKIRWYEKGVQEYMADSESEFIPLKKQLTMTLLLFIAVSLSLYAKHLMHRDHFVIYAEIYGVILMALIVHTCRAVHHGYTRMPIEGDDMDRMEEEMRFFVDTFDEKTMPLISTPTQASPAPSETTTAQSPSESPAAPEASEPSASPGPSETSGTSGTSETSETSGASGTPGTPGTSSDLGKKDVMEYVQASDIEQELKRVMIVKKLYLQQNITIKDVANAIGTNHYYLSVYLNRIQHISFSDYINRLRIEREVLPRMKSNPNISTKELIIAGNFTHRTTFYRAFQKVMGVPFQDYKSSLKA